MKKKVTEREHFWTPGMIVTLVALAFVVLFFGAATASEISSCSKNAQGLSGTWYAQANDVFNGDEVWANLTLDGDEWKITGDVTPESGRLQKEGDVYKFFENDGTTLLATATKSADGERLVFDGGFLGFTGEIIFHSTKADAQTNS